MEFGEERQVLFRDLKFLEANQTSVFSQVIEGLNLAFFFLQNVAKILYFLVQLFNYKIILIRAHLFTFIIVRQSHGKSKYCYSRSSRNVNF